MKVWHIGLVLALLSAVCGSVRGQEKAVVPTGKERRAILEALRVPVQKQLKCEVRFVVDRLKTQSGSAFLLGRPIQKNGKPIDYGRTPFKEAKEAGAFDDGICALLQKKQGKWRVTAYVIGATDVPYEDWPKRYKAPPSIFR